MKLLKTLSSFVLNFVLFFAVVGFSLVSTALNAFASDTRLTDADKIKRIMSVAEKAKEPRNFYRWQSETSGNNLVAAGEYNEKLFNYFMSMTVDSAHFAGGRGVYYAEDITSSSQFIRGEGKGSLIEVRIPKGMPTLDLTNRETVKKLERLGVTPDDVLKLDPPLAVRYSSSGWWAVKRREGVKFQPFNSGKLPLDTLVKALGVVEDNPRAAEVLEPHVTLRVETEIAKDKTLLVRQPKLQRLVSKKTLEKAILESPELQNYFVEKFKAGQYKDLPGTHFGTILSTAKKLGIEIDGSKMFSQLTTAQKIIFLDEVHSDTPAPEPILKALLEDELVSQSPYKLKPSELKAVTRHVLPYLQRRSEALIEFPRAFHLLSSAELVPLLKSSEALRQHFSKALGGTYFDLPLAREAGPVLADFKAAGVEFDDLHVFSRMELPKRLQYLDHFYPDRAAPKEMVDLLVSKQGLEWATASPYVTRSLTSTLSRIAGFDPEILDRNPETFQYLDKETLQKVIAQSESVRNALHAGIEQGKFNGVAEKSLLQLSSLLSANGKPVSENGLFKNLDLDAKLGYIQQTFSGRKLPVPLTFVHDLFDDKTIQLNGRISDSSLEKLGQIADEALFSFGDDINLINKATRLFSSGKAKTDGRALIGFENKSKEVQAALHSYVYSFLNGGRVYERGAESTRTQVLNSLVAARYQQWDNAHFKLLNTYWDDENLLTSENKKILEEEIVKKLADPGVRDKEKVAQWAGRFVRDPSEQSAAAIFDACNQFRSAGIPDCWPKNSDRTSLYEKSAAKVLANSPERYVATLKTCLANGGCWMLRAIHNTKPPANLSLKQVKDLLSSYKATTADKREILHDNMIELVARHWRQMPDELLGLFEEFPSGRFWSDKRTEELRMRRAAVLSEVGENLAKDLSVKNLALARVLVRASSFDEAHERYDLKGNYDLVSKIKYSHQQLSSATFKLEEKVRAAELSRPQTVEAKVEPVAKAAQATDPLRPPLTTTSPMNTPATSPATVAPAKSNSCASLFQKLGQFLKTRGR